MSNNNGNLNNADKTGDVMGWVIVIILMFAFPPAGWILLLAKLGIIGSKNKNKTNTGNKSYVTINEKSDTKSTVVDNTKSTNKKEKSKRSRLDKKTGKGVSLLLLLTSIGFFVTGAVMTIDEISSLLSTGSMNFALLIWGIFWLLGGAVTFFSRNNFANKISRFKNYNAFIEGRGVIPISDIAQMAGLSPKKVKNDLQAMINNGYLDSSIYIDNELDCLVISAEEAHKLRTSIKDLVDEPAISDDSIGQYKASLAELREAGEFISDETISQKVSRLEDLTKKIFKIIEENPQKKPQLRRFTTYYLPTTLKLVRSYATLEKQGVKGENIMSTKKSIGDILDTLSTGFEQQLDQLFKSDAIDIAADISVLENLMQQDGLTSDNSGFQVAESGGS